MTTKPISFITLFSLLLGAGIADSVATVAAAGQGSATDVSATVDVPSPRSFAADGVGRRGGRAARIELADGGRHQLSTFYRLAYVDGGTRLQLFEHYPATTTGPAADMAISQATAWKFANRVVGTPGSATVPRWAHVATGGDTGLSAGLIFTLADIDALTPGALAGNLRIAGTGGIGSDGVVTPAFGLDAKLAAAMLADPDVVFVTGTPPGTTHHTVIAAHSTRLVDAGVGAGEWLNVGAFRRAGRLAAADPGSTAVVEVHDVRQALAWLCGRTGIATSCDVARRAADVPIGAV